MAKKFRVTKHKKQPDYRLHIGDLCATVEYFCEPMQVWKKVNNYDKRLLLIKCCISAKIGTVTHVSME